MILFIAARRARSVCGASGPSKSEAKTKGVSHFGRHGDAWGRDEWGGGAHGVNVCDLRVEYLLWVCGNSGAKGVCDLVDVLHLNCVQNQYQHLISTQTKNYFK